MSTTTPNTLDLAQYRENTEALVESMDETTALFHDMADNMSELSTHFDDFGRSN